MKRQRTNGKGPTAAERRKSLDSFVLTDADQPEMPAAITIEKALRDKPTSPVMGLTPAASDVFTGAVGILNTAAMPTSGAAQR